MTDGAEDAELLMRWRAGDEQAGRQLFENNFDRVFAFFWRRVGPGTDDLVQQTLMACVEGRDRVTPDRFSAYLFSVARRKLADFIGQRLPEQFEEAAASNDPCAAMLAREESKLLLYALRSLPLDDQVVLEMYYWESRSVPALAQAQGVSLGTAKSRLRRARKRLETSIRELAASSALQQSTESGLDDWAASIADYLRQMK